MALLMFPKAAVILPHGVLFRGNAEAAIRCAIIDNGFVKGIIGLSANLFYGTGIPACIIVIDKENSSGRDGIFMIDASREFIKDGKKNRLRERDIYKIVTVFNEQIEISSYSRFVPNDEIKNKNAYNLNIPRYIDGGSLKDLQNIDAHLNGGIPNTDIENLPLYWDTFPKLRKKLFKPLRKGFASLTVGNDEVRDTIYSDMEFSTYANKVETTFENWKARKERKRTLPKKKLLKDLKDELDDKARKQYDKLTNTECLDLLLERKWYAAIISGISALYDAVNHHIADYVAEITERCELTLPELESKTTKLESKVKSHLKTMGYVW